MNNAGVGSRIARTRRFLHRVIFCGLAGINKSLAASYLLFRMRVGGDVGWESDDMRTNPISDAFEFLTQGEWTSYVFLLLTIGSIVIAAAFVGTLMAINLWLGLYRSPAEWPWTYFFLIVVQIMLLVHRPGRSLGLDAILLRHGQESSDGGSWGHLMRLLS